MLFPALRLAYLVVPPNMIDRFAAAQSVSMRYAPLIDQAVLCDFINEGHLVRHLRRMRELYAERLSALIESARENLAGLLEISGVEAGLQTVGWLTLGINAEHAAKRAAELDIEVVPLSRYATHHSSREGLILGFAAVDARELRRGTERLGSALRAL